jgi:5-methylcytosine-specific restriction endonuclease McrA
MEPHTLILNPWMTPHGTCSWQKAMTLYFNGKLEILEEYEETISSPNFTIRTPAVVRLKKPVSTFKKGVKFSRVNVLTRDNFTCCYCGKKLPAKDLNYDHVVPRKQGGKTVWDNIVASCYPCNDKKAGRTPQQAGMKLLRKPHRPRTLPLSGPMLNLHEVHDLWKPYIEAARGMMAVG